MKLSVHAIPLQSALPVPKSRQVCQLPHRGAEELCVFAQDFIKLRVPAAPLSLALLDSSPIGGAKGGLYEFAQGFIKQ